jgi:hypothetical protein
MDPYYVLPIFFLHKLFGINSQAIQFKLRLKLEIKIKHLKIKIEIVYLYYRLYKTLSPLRIDVLFR